MSKIQSSPSDYLEVDQVEEQLGRLGSYGNVPEVPVANSARSVFWFGATASGDGDASSAGNCAALAYNSVATYCTANRRDVCVILQGGYNINGATGGVAASVAGVKIFGLGGNFCDLQNGNAAATAVFTVSAVDVEIAGLYVAEITNSVEGIVCTSSDLCVHHCYFKGGMENGIGVSGTNPSRVKVYNCVFDSNTNDGIELTGTTTQLCRIHDNEFVAIGDNAISLNGDGVDRNFVYNNIIHGANGTTDVGINIALGDNNICVNNWIYECVLSEQDTGSNNSFDNHCPKKRVVYPASGAGISITSSGAGADTWGSWVTVMTPSAPFTVETIEVDFLHKAEHHVQVGASGDTNADRVHLQVRESGTVGAFTRANPKFYPQGTTISARQKSRLGSGGPSTLWVWTEEPD